MSNTQLWLILDYVGWLFMHVVALKIFPAEWVCLVLNIELLILQLLGMKYND